MNANASADTTAVKMKKARSLTRGGSAAGAAFDMGPMSRVAGFVATLANWLTLLGNTCGMKCSTGYYWILKL
ncbi:hypothetical protein MVI01_08130 [Myxococcus virescens]|uniref:Uncharacterized protein n=1 Tax=Myxococcus virescens TaxID=83456 RepID=A0A511H8F8_9BACT|nr:hypothetical protein MVI01_08130 [Myxococcus virescens]